MTHRLIATVGLRALGIYLMYLSLESAFRILAPLFETIDLIFSAYVAKASGTGAAISAGSKYYGIGAPLFLFVSKFLCGLFVYLNASRLAVGIVSEKENQRLDVQVGAYELQRIAFAFVGLLILMQVVPILLLDIVDQIIATFSWTAQPGLSQSPNNIRDVIFQLIQVGLAVHLMGARGTIQYLRAGRLMSSRQNTEHDNSRSNSAES